MRTPHSKPGSPESQPPTTEQCTALPQRQRHSFRADGPPRLIAAGRMVLVCVAALLVAGCGATGAGDAGAVPATNGSVAAANAPVDATAASSATAGSSATADSGAPVSDGHDHDAAPSTPAAGPASQKQFPPSDQLDKIVAAYTVANEHPELLTGLPCYCPCELYGHGGVIDCHRSQHAAMCNVCMDEAIEAGRLYEGQVARGEQPDIAAAQAYVKDRYRRALVQQAAQQLPMTNTPQGQAFLQACSDCHQPPSPAMHTVADWDKSLTRMEQYARGSNAMPDPQIWEAAVGYVKGVAAQVPATNVAQMRQSLQTTVEHLQATEGDAAYYPSVRDDVLDPAWAVRMSAAYDAARELPAELLAATPTACTPCNDAGNTDLLSCLNSWQAITCETAIEEIERLAAEQGR